MATRILTLYSTTIGKKAVMAVSGLILIGFLIGHLSGNLLVFSEHGHQAINDYSHWLREFGHGVVIWIVRAGLLAAALAHIWSAMSLTAHNRAARPVRYQRKQDLAATLSSKTMAYGGIALFLYFIYHLAHLTFGKTVPTAPLDLSLVPGEYTPLAGDAPLLIDHDVYASIVNSFQQPAIAGVYILAQLFLGLHLYHGVWSCLQTLGFNHPRYNDARKLGAAALAGLISVGFITIPVAVMVGIVK